MSPVKMPGERLKLLRDEMLEANIDGVFIPEQRDFVGGEIVTFFGRAGDGEFQILALEFFDQFAMVKVTGLDPKGTRVIAAVVGQSVDDVIRQVRQIDEE